MQTSPVVLVTLPSTAVHHCNTENTPRNHQTIFNHVCKNFEAELVEMDGETDHVHLLVNYPPKVAVSVLVNSLKGVSSRKLKQTCPAIQKHYFKNTLWSRSYFASSCGGAPIEIVRKYIENEKTPN